MKKISLFLLGTAIMMSCNENTSVSAEVETPAETEFQWSTEKFGDIQILRYQIEGWEKLSLNQKKLAYYLTQAGLAGRDITWDQFYRHNLEIRSSLENIVKEYKGDKESDLWKNFMVYTKRVWFSNGIHHHYSNVKMKPDFSLAAFDTLLTETNTSISVEAKQVIFNDKDAKKVSKDSDSDLVLSSAVNFYDPDITEAEASAFYKNQIAERSKGLSDSALRRPISFGLNSKLIRNAEGEIEEQVWKIDGLYGSAISEIVKWLELAQGVAENQAQGDAFGILIDYYKTGDLKKWDEYNVAWVGDTAGDIDYINSFIEVYDDPLGYKATYETVVQVKDLDASEKMSVISENIQYFEDSSSIMEEHKKKKVVGVSYSMINVVGEAGATTPATPIGVNLPNANWIRTEHGSKSVSLANIEHAYDQAKGSGFLEEFCYTKEELQRAKNHANASSKMHTALHEVVGHASGQINEGIGTPKETLKNYASTLEEGRADLVALFYIVDPKILELGLVESMEVGKAEYDSYIRNGMMLQLRRLDMGDDIEEDHMRNRQLVASWAYEMGRAENVIEKKVVEGKTYFVINDYDKLKVLFGDLLREIQRIKSEGDYEAGKNLVETYAVKVDPQIHQEVLDRSKKFEVAPYLGFIQPQLEPVMVDGEITDVEVVYPKDFQKQMLMYSEKYSFLK